MASPLYERVADRIGRQIRSGVLRAGDRMPSLRRVSSDQQVSMATAVEAYLLLERQGLLEARPRSGYYVRLPAAPLPRESAPRARKPQWLRNPGLLGVLDVLARRDVLPLHAATPAAGLLPVAALRGALQQVLRRDPDVIARYAAPQGVYDLRLRIAERYARCGVDVDPDEIIITAGAMEALSLALRVITKPGDVVLLEKPTYHGLLQAVAALQLRVVEVPTHADGGIDVACLQRQLARQPVRAAVLVPNINNPLGSITHDAAKRTIADACAAHGTVVIEDDLYGELAYSGERPAPLRRFDITGNTITCGSYSKSLAPGLRVGWALGGRWAQELLRAKSFSTIETSTLPQLAIADFLSRHDYDRHLRRLRRHIADNAQRMRDAIVRRWPVDTCACAPSGGLSLWVRLPPGVEGQTVFEAALAEGIGTLPGHLFSLHGEHHEHLRLSCGQVWSDQIAKALQTLGGIVENAARVR